MKIKLLKLKLQNFKGIKNLTIDFNENVTNIFGDNGTGKTTIFDAYSWLLFNKDSLNNTKFNIKTLDKNGEVISNIEHIVEGAFIFDDKKVVYKKEYKEQWTKKRGSSEQTYTGNTTDYFINEVPKSETEYKKSIASVIDEETFKLISNPRYFNVDLDKKKRREILMAISDDVPNEEIIKINDELKDLDLENYSVEEIQAINKVTYKKTGEEIKELPVRIDELYSSIKDIDVETLDIRKRTIMPAIQKIDDEIIKGDTSVGIKTINEKISELVLEQIDIKNKVDEENRQIKITAEVKNREIENEKNSLDNQIKEFENKINYTKTKIKDLNDNVINLRKEYEREAAKIYDGSNICPVCNQELPYVMQEEAQNKFNLNKSKILEKITINANTFKDEMLKNSSEVKSNETILVTIKEDLEKLNIIEIQEYKLKEYPKKFYEIDTEIAKLKEKLNNSKSNDNKELLNKKLNLQEELDEINSQLAYSDVNNNTKNKIKEYEKEQKELAKILLEAEKTLSLCDEYTKIKSELISKDINTKFNFVEFKLFEKQVNGGINEVCDATVKGVPYSDVNNAARINAGLDIINTLSKHYGIYAPIFVDNAESVNTLIETESQVVRLVVSKDKELKVK